MKKKSKNHLKKKPKTNRNTKIFQKSKVFQQLIGECYWHTVHQSGWKMIWISLIQRIDFQAIQMLFRSMYMDKHDLVTFFNTISISNQNHLAFNVWLTKWQHILHIISKSMENVLTEAFKCSHSIVAALFCDFSLLLCWYISEDVKTQLKISLIFSID